MTHSDLDDDDLDLAPEPIEPWPLAVEYVSVAIDFAECPALSIRRTLRAPRGPRVRRRGLAVFLLLSARATIQELGACVSLRACGPSNSDSRSPARAKKYISRASGKAAMISNAARSTDV